MTAPAPWNVVFVMSDQHRRDSAGCYGHPLVQTPHLDGLAREGVRFDRAYAASPICGPCRSAVLTGRYVHRCGGLTHRHLHHQPGLPTLGTTFRNAGYVTAAFGKIHAAGQDEEHDLGFDERALEIYQSLSSDYQHAIGLENFWKYCSYLPQYRPAGNPESRNMYNPANRPIDLADELILDHMVAGRSIDFMRRHVDQPFCLWVGFEKPHTEWYAPARYHALYNPADIPLPDDIWEDRSHLPQSTFGNKTFPIVTREAYTDEQLRCCMAAYYANITYMDDQLGKVLSELDRLGIADRTVVIYTTDHGDNLFNHGLVHKHCFFETAVGVPLVIRAPGLLPAGAVRRQLTTLIDLLPTVVDLAGVPDPGGMDGRSLRAIAAGDAPGPDAVFSEFYEFNIAERMIRTDRWKYVHTEGDVSQLYDTEVDPGEHSNLALDSNYAELCASLDARLHKGWRKPSAGELTGKIPVGGLHEVTP